MRLIDADAIADNIAVLLERNPKLIDEWLANIIEDEITEAPTITEVEIVNDYCRRRNYVLVAAEDLNGLAHGAVKPIRRGRWEAMDWANEYYKCSECGRIERWSPNYCASCGSKMATRTRYVRGTPNIIEEPNGRAKMEEEE